MEEPLTLVWAAARGAKKLAHIQWGYELVGYVAGREIAQRVVRREKDGSVKDLVNPSEK